nr:hypothetical protein [Geotalea uraniireducens]
MLANVEGVLEVIQGHCRG